MWCFTLLCTNHSGLISNALDETLCTIIQMESYTEAVNLYGPIYYAEFPGCGH